MKLGFTNIYERAPEFFVFEFSFENIGNFLVLELFPFFEEVQITSESGEFNKQGKLYFLKILSKENKFKIKLDPSKTFSFFFKELPSLDKVPSSILLEKDLFIIERKKPEIKLFKLLKIKKEDLYRKIYLQKKIPGIYSFFCPKNLEKYFFLEGILNKSVVQQFFEQTKLLATELGSVGTKEIEDFLKPPFEKIFFKKGDLVEILNKNFKRKRAKIVEIDVLSKTLVLKLVDTFLDLTITLPSDQVRIVQQNE